MLIASAAPSIARMPIRKWERSWVEAVETCDMETIEEAHERAGTEDEIAFHNQRIDQCKPEKR
jgi:hypothetical protein